MTEEQRLGLMTTLCFAISATLATVAIKVWKNDRATTEGGTP